MLLAARHHLGRGGLMAAVCEVKAVTILKRDSGTACMGHEPEAADFKCAMHDPDI